MEEQKTEDYKERLQKARQRRNGKDPMHWFMIGGCAVIVVLALVIIVKLAQGGTFGGSGNARVASASEAEAQETVIGETLPEDEEQAKEDEEKKNVVESYQNLGIVDVSGYLNMRESASTTSDVIGKLTDGRKGISLLQHGCRNPEYYLVSGIFRRSGGLHQFRICTDRRGGKNRGI